MPDNPLIFGGELDAAKDYPIEVRERFENQRLRRWIVIVILVLFSASNLTTLALFVWKAIAEHGDLRDQVLLYMAGTNLSQCAAVLLLAAKFLFHGPTHK